MQAPLTRKFILNKNCRHCGIKYSQKHIENIFGKDSAPATLGYCSASCYTKSLIEAGTKINSLYAKGECKLKYANAEIYPHSCDIKGEPIANISGEKINFTIIFPTKMTVQEAEANAHRIAKCWNMHSEAMDIILGLVRESKSGDTEIVKMAIDLLNRDKE